MVLQQTQQVQVQVHDLPNNNDIRPTVLYINHISHPFLRGVGEDKKEGKEKRTWHWHFVFVYTP